MKEDKNMFFIGQLPHRRAGAAYENSPEAPSLWGWGADRIKNIFLSSFIPSFLFLSISHADTVPSQVCHQDNCVAVEVVSKQEDMERGLMFRTGLGQNKGMLFVFTSDDKQQFWMKNMSFNLDIIWISRDGHIVYINEETPACKADPCPVYTPDRPGHFVLELSGGYVSTHHWKQGDLLSLKGVLKN